MASAKRLRAFADRSACCGYGLCAEICPQVYKLDAESRVVIEGELVPEGLEEAARDGAAICPQSALRVEEVDALSIK